MKISTSGKKHILAACVIAVAAAGCYDMTTDQYHDQLSRDYAAKTEAVSGLYAGSLTSLDGKTQMGGIELNIIGTVTPVVAPDGTTNSSQAVIRGSVKVIGQITAEASLSQGAYDPDTGNFNATISIPEANGSSETLTIRGTVNGKTLNGDIRPDLFPDSGGKFQTVLNGALPSVATLSSGLADPAVSAQFYTGPLTTPDPTCRTIANGKVISTGQCTVAMSIQDASTTVADTFGDFFLPTTDVIISLSFDDTVDTSAASAALQLKDPFGFGGTIGTAQYDRKNGRLIGMVPMANASGAELSLNCNQATTSGSSEKNGWSCTLSTNQRGTIDQFQVAPAQLQNN